LIPIMVIIGFGTLTWIGSDLYSPRDRLAALALMTAGAVPYAWCIVFATHTALHSLFMRGGLGCLNSFSASISGASAAVRLPSGVAAG
ncbi:MAG: hypothetical protein WA801_02700, partial [Pseudolabrys sp.]